MQLIVEIKNLTVEYPGVKALENVSFSVNQGDFLGIIGPNGAGKSTLFSCMLGLQKKYQGTIKFFGQDIKKSQHYLKEIGYVPQKPILPANQPMPFSLLARTSCLEAIHNTNCDLCPSLYTKTEPENQHLHLQQSHKPFSSRPAENGQGFF